ncbi:MAG: sugar phosphate isomerase/epimerase [Aureliella sp.]
MPELNIGIGISCLRQPIKKALHTAHKLGGSGVEIDLRNPAWPKELSDTGLRQLRKMMDDLNLRVATTRFPTRRGFDVAADLERRIDATKNAMRTAYRLGTRVLVTAVGYVPEDKESPSYLQLRESLEDLARFSQHVGTMLACETGSEPVERLVELLDSIESPAIGVAFNPGSLIVQDNYSIDSIRQCAHRVLSVVACDGVRDLSIGRGLQVPLGQGSSEFPEILGVLEDVPFRGWFIVDRPSSDDLQYELSNAVKFLRSM